MASEPAQLDKKLRVAIIGGGIGGLTCAIALKNRPDIEISIYETAEQIAEVGAGFSLWPRTWNIVKTMGLEQDLLDILPVKPSDENRLLFTLRKSNQKEGHTFLEIFGADNMPFHRQEMQKVLLKHLPSSCELHLNHCLDRCEESRDSVKLFFKNGVVSSCDVVIGADGVKSAVRRSLLAQNPSMKYPNNGIRYTGTISYRGLIQRDKLVSVNPEHQVLSKATLYCGKRRQIVAYPISKGSIINVVAFVIKPTGEEKEEEIPPRRSVTNDEILSYFSGWEDEVQHLLSLLENPIAWPIQDLVPLDSYVSSRIALLGDAAHAMTPHLAAGACQAIEDAWMLGNLLAQSKCDTHSVPRVLKIYDEIRRPKGNFIMKTSRARMSDGGFDRPEYDGAENDGPLRPEQAAFFKSEYDKGDAWRWENAESDLKQAISMI